MLKDIDMAGAMERMHVSEDVYIGILRTYYRDLKNAVSRIKEAKGKADIKRFVVDVHGVKSTSASVGVMELSRLARELETAGKERDWTFVDENIGLFLQTCEEVIGTLQQFFEKEETGVNMEMSVLEPEWVQNMYEACEDLDSMKAAELLKKTKVFMNLK